LEAGHAGLRYGERVVALPDGGKMYKSYKTAILSWVPVVLFMGVAAFIRLRSNAASAGVPTEERFLLWAFGVALVCFDALREFWVAGAFFCFDERVLDGQA
jgi:hypothetical protein